MNSVRIIIFDVEHGFCGAAIDSNNNLLLIDCGRKTYFSPVRYLAQRFNVDLDNLEIGLFVLSHPHGDHIQDVDNLLESNIKNISRVKVSNFTDEELRDGNTSEGYNNIQKFERGCAHFRPEWYSPPQWLFSINRFSLLVTAARQIDYTQVINNSSKVVILEFGGKKIIFCGDIQRSGWDRLLNDQDFVNAAICPSVVIAPHHGHRSSYTSSLYETIGKPYFNICSLANDDPHLAQEYSTDKTSIGTELSGRFRRMLSTRSDGTIVIDLFEDSWTVDFEDLDDNERNT